MKKIVYFHPKINLPPLGGGDTHSHEILKTLKEMGYKIFLFLLEIEEQPIITRTNWGYEEVYLFKKTADRLIIKRALSKYIDEIKPQFIFMNYASWDCVLDHEKHASIKRIIYNHHFESIRYKMGTYYRDVWNKHLPKSYLHIYKDLYAQDLFKKKDFKPDPKEYEVYDRYDLTFVCADFGAALIKTNCKKTQVVSFPVTLTPKESQPKYQKLALFTVSPYTFAFQGYYFFIKCILPLILKREPLFRVRLFGPGSELFLPAPNIICKKYVLNLEGEYQKASMTLCPSFSGTGQQIKIIEAMHYGIAPVSMENPMQFNPTINAETGFVAKTAEEFADYTLRLYQNRELAMEMGQNAQRYARANFTNTLLKERLKSVEVI